MNGIYDQEQEHADAQAEAQAIIDAVDRCAHGLHNPEPTDLHDDEGDVFVCQFCQVRVN